jgi:hypothetical protein
MRPVRDDDDRHWWGCACGVALMGAALAVGMLAGVALTWCLAY